MKYLLALGLVGMARGSSGSACPKTVTANFIGASGVSDYVVSIDGTDQNDPPITMCHGDTLNVTGSVFGNHPLKIWQGETPVHQNAGAVILSEGTYTYKCDRHSNMNAQITVKSSSDPQCACVSTQPITDPGHPCDAHTCPTGFTQRHPLPDTVNDFPKKRCCRPKKKGCMTAGKANYDSTAEISGPCFGLYKTDSQKADDFANKNSFLEKRGVHKQHAKEDFYKKRANGKTKRLAIREARATVLETDLSEKVKKRARGVVKVAIAINSGEDSCELGAVDDNCGSLDLADDRADNETTILTTEDDENSWAVVVDGGDIIVKQTRKQNGKFDMQCWVNDTWDTAVEKDPADADVVTHRCGTKVFLVGSQQLACDENTCPGGCDNDGLCPTTTTEMGGEEAAETSSTNTSACSVLKQSNNATGYIEAQCCNNC